MPNKNKNESTTVETPKVEVKVVKLEVSSIKDLAVKLLCEPIDESAPEADQRRLSTERIIEEIRKAFPGAKTTPACIAWYASKLRNDGSFRGKNGGKLPLKAVKQN